MINMAKFTQAVTSYNLANYLLPGILFVIFVDKMTNYSFLQKDMIAGLFLYYFIGMIVSRIGSLFVEPLLKQVGFLKFADYSDFAHASKEDEKISALSEQNNQYRTMVTMILMLGFLKLWEVCVADVLPNNAELLVFLLASLILFMHAYKKQTEFIASRVNRHKNKTKNLNKTVMGDGRERRK